MLTTMNPEDPMMSYSSLLPSLGLAASISAVFLLLLVLTRRYKAKERQLTNEYRALSRQYTSSLQDTRALLDQAPEVVLVFERQWLKLIYANRQALEFFSCDNEEELMDRVFSRPDYWQKHPFSLLDFETWLGQARDVGVARREWYLNTGSNAGIWFDCQVSNSVFAGQKARVFTGVNIHNRKMERVEDHLRERILRSINADSSQARILAMAAKLAEVQMPNARCIISVYDPGKDVLVTHGKSRFAKEFRSFMPEVPALYGVMSIGSAAHTKSRVVSENIQQGHLFQGYSQQLRKMGVESAWSEPLLDLNDNLLAVITMFSAASRKPDDYLVQKMSSVVSLVGLSIERQRWKRELELSSMRERFIREIGVDVVNLPSENYKQSLALITRRICDHYELGSLVVWELRPDDGALIAIAGTESKLPSPMPHVILEDSSDTGRVDTPFLGAVEARRPFYLTKQDRLYQDLKHSESGKPVLVIPLYSDEDTDSFMGLISAEGLYQYIATATIDYLQVIGSMIKTSLISRQLKESLLTAANYERRIREKLENELDVAKDIQMSMVPGAGEFHKTYRSWRIEGWLRPARAVGGDFYEAIALSNGLLLLAVGDVSDKGAPAALFMARTVSLLNFLARNHAGDLKEIADSLNRELCRGNEACMFTTLIMVAIDLGNGSVQILSAGHDSPLQRYVDRSPAFWEGESGPPLGLYENTSYKAQALEIPVGSSLVLYSDGITEAFNQDGIEFGGERLLSLGNKMDGVGESFLACVRGRLAGYTEGADQSDDMTLMTIHHHGFE